ncbi:MAG: HEPN domain-containing protein [Methanosarcinales archaeon]|nr:HEPN domain-containing protein [Methanosarcinales archaeon]
MKENRVDNGVMIRACLKSRDQEVTNMKNIRKTRDWIEMALEDLDNAVASVTEGRYPGSVFYAQQCTEKLLKAVLYFLE